MRLPVLMIVASVFTVSGCSAPGSTGPTEALPQNTAIPQTNNAPTISGNPTRQVDANSRYEFTPTANDADGDNLVYSISGLPDWASFDDATGRLSGTPDASHVGTYDNIIVSVSDGSLKSSLPEFSVTVMATNSPPPTNSAPTISGNPPASVTANSQYRFTPKASDPDGDDLKFSISRLPNWATFKSTTGRLSGTPDASHVGTYDNIVVSVSDGKLKSSLREFSITVMATNSPPPTNSAPTISGNPPASVTANSQYRFTPRASDPDGDDLRFSISRLPSWASFNSTTGRLSGIPDASHVGTYDNIVVSVSDGKLESSLREFSITVLEKNSAPEISGNPPSQINANSRYDFTPTASDADGDDLTFSASRLPGWARFSTSTGRITGTPSDADVSTYSNIRITVSDGSESDTLGPFSITVQQATLGSVTLSWKPPTRNDDGTALTDLAGYRIYWGTTPGNYPNSIRIDNAGISSHVIDNLAPGTYEFVATSINTAGVESVYSNIAVRTVSSD